MLAPGNGSWDVHRRIAAILRKSGASDTSQAACRKWAREFIQRYVHDWVPGKPLTAEQAWKLGELFIKRCVTAGVAFPSWEFPKHARKLRRDPDEDTE